MNVQHRQDELVVEVGSETETQALAAAVAALVAPGTVIALVGPLGAGKTRFTRALAEALGVDPAAIASPTFMLIHEYDGCIPVYHFDAYRLNDADEFDALGASDYWDAGGVCLVEWADRVADRLPAAAWTVRVEPTGPAARRFGFRWPEGGSHAEVLAAALAV
jgi:tRNA threonylcarbamoyladenosine biosynthesis protein TsaE